MAEKRTTTEPASGPVPRARAAAEPPPAKATKQATKATKTKAATKAAKRAKATEPAKTTRASKATKATRTTAAAKTTKAARATKAAKATKAPTGEPAKTAQKPAKTAQKPAKTASRPAKEAAAQPADPSLAPPPGAWRAAVREALSETDQPPHRLAELAVVELGPRAAAWARWLRDTYPDPPAHGIARLAAHEARQTGWAVAAAEAAGPITAALSLPAAAWVRAMLVLRIAAAYGHDPTDPQRAADLIELLELRPGASRLPVAPGLLNTVRGRRRRLAGFAAARLGVRRTPILAALRTLIAGGDLSEQLDRLAHRATAHYRHGSRDSTSASAASISSPNKP